MGGLGGMMGAEAELPAKPRAAATVVLARDLADADDAAKDGIEIFLVRRHDKIGFMGGLHVFPGGKVSDEDRGAALRSCIADPGRIEAHDIWGEGFDREDAFALALAGVRETYEEAGVLLGHGAPSQPALDAAREQLHAGAAFSDLLKALGVELSLDLLTPLSRWITPDTEPVRFDTAFYVARAPGAQRATHDQREVVGGDWFTPERALSASRMGEIRLAPPTEETLGSLSAVGSVSEAETLARSRPPPVILPLLRHVGDELVVLYPGDPEHPSERRALPGPTRRVLRKL